MGGTRARGAVRAEPRAAPVLRLVVPPNGIAASGRFPGANPRARRHGRCGAKRRGRSVAAVAAGTPRRPCGSASTRPCSGRGVRCDQHGGRRSRPVRRPDHGDDVLATGIRPVDDAVARWRSVLRERFGDGGEPVHAAGGVTFNGPLVRDLGFHVRRLDHPFRVNGQRSPHHAHGFLGRTRLRDGAGECQQRMKAPGAAAR